MRRQLNNVFCRFKPAEKVHAYKAAFDNLRSRSLGCSEGVWWRPLTISPAVEMLNSKQSRKHHKLRLRGYL